MRIEGLLWAGVAAYFVVIGALYYALSEDPIGAIALAGGAAMGGLMAGWIWFWRRSNQVRAEDRADADAADGEGIVGVYPTASLRPLGLAVGMCAIPLGIVLGLWMTLTGVAIVASQAILLTRDEDS